MHTDKPQSVDQIIKQNGFLFVDIPRTGSTSLKEELATLYGPVYGKEDAIFGNQETKPWPDHTSARQAIERLGRDTWDNLFTFALVRNPWDRAYSLFQYRRRYAMDIPMDMTFSTFVQKLSEQKKLKPEERTWFQGYVMSSCDYLLDTNGQMAVKFVGKFEEREHALTTINQHLPIPLRGGLFRMASTAGTTPFQTFYSPEDRDLIAQAYADDIQQFQYTFDDTPLSADAIKTTELPHEDWLAYARRLGAENGQLKLELAAAQKQNAELIKPTWNNLARMLWRKIRM